MVTLVVEKTENLSPTLFTLGRIAHSPGRARDGGHCEKHTLKTSILNR